MINSHNDRSSIYSTAEYRYTPHWGDFLAAMAQDGLVAVCGFCRRGPSGQRVLLFGTFQRLESGCRIGTQGDDGRRYDPL